MKEKRSMNYTTQIILLEKDLDEYSRLLGMSHDWLFAAWKENDPFEKQICKIRFCQYRKKANELNKQICLKSN